MEARMDQESSELGDREHGTGGKIHWAPSQVYIPVTPSVHVHHVVVRNGQDWVRACDHVTRPGVTALFSSPQCLGYRGERGELGEQLCRPGADTIISQLGEAIRSASLDSK